MFSVKKLVTLIDGVIDRLDNSEDVIKTYYCFINRTEGRREGRKKLQVGERNLEPKYEAG